MKPGDNVVIFSEYQKILIYGLVVQPMGEALKVRSIYSNDEFIRPGELITTTINDIFSFREAIEIVFQNL